MADLGGTGQFYAPGTIQLGGHETIEDSARVMSRLLDILEARVDRHEDLVELAKYATIPVINGMSDYNHPHPGAGRPPLTMIEHLPEGKRIENCKMVFVGDATQVCVSEMFITSKMGMTFVQYGPEGHQIREDLLEIGRKNCEVSGRSQRHRQPRGGHGLRLRVHRRVVRPVRQGAVEGRAHGHLLPDVPGHRGAVAMAAPDAKFMDHCLPASRGEEVTDAVIDGPQSICWTKPRTASTPFAVCWRTSASRPKPTSPKPEKPTTS